MSQSRKKLIIKQKEVKQFKLFMFDKKIIILTFLAILVFMGVYFLWANVIHENVNLIKENKPEIPVEQQKYERGVYVIDTSKYVNNIKILDEPVSIMAAMDSLNMHATKKIEIARLFNIKQLPAGSKLIDLREKNYPDIPVYVILESDPEKYKIISFRENTPVISEYTRKLNKVIKRQLINMGHDPVASFVAQTNASLLTKVEEVLAWKTDFTRLDSGDQIKIAFEELTFLENNMGCGKLLAIDWIYKSGNFKAYLIPGKTDENGQELYCDEDGRPLKESFRKSPVNYGRISSRFSFKRFHPTLKIFKAHNGTDFAAPEGSPLMSVGDGVITIVSNTPNNGNFIKVKHNNTYTTQYLHLSKFKNGLRPGVSVRQGDVIGYVGHTGLASGPHVCLRLWKNNVQVDFLREKFPRLESINSYESELFRNIKFYYSAYLNDLKK